MMRYLLIPVVFAFSFSPTVFAETQQEQAQFISSWVGQVQGTVPAPPQDPKLPPIKCGTPAFLAAANFRHFHPDITLDVKIERPDLPDTFGTEHFLIHYTTTGNSAVFEPNTDSLAGIPRHITRVADVLEHVWSVEIDSMGYQTPLRDFGQGGDDRYDVYIRNLVVGYYGQTTADSIIGYRASSYIEIENDFQEISNEHYHLYPIDAVKVTMAHEFFHAIQFSYDASEIDRPNPDNHALDSYWWYEASSTWMETVVYNSIKDYYGYLPSFYKHIWMNLSTYAAAPLHAYGSCVWPIFMVKRFGDINIMRDIWERCGASAGYNTLPATDGALRDRGSDIASAFLEFEIWNFQTGPLADTVNYYTDGHHYTVAETTAYISNLEAISPFTIPSNLQFPQQYATNYFILNSPGSTGGIIANFNGQDLPAGQKWRVALMGFRENDSQWHDIQVDESSGIGSGDWPGWNAYRCIVLVSTVTGLNPNYSSFSYGGNLIYDSTLTGGHGNDAFALLKTYPSPYLIYPDSLLTIKYTLDKNYRRSDLDYRIYDGSGALVKEARRDESLPNYSGENIIHWDGKSSAGDYIASGIYIILFRAGDNTATGKIAVINHAK
jgi:hypothetical protein